jgi:hypothetical protein
LDGLGFGFSAGQDDVPLNPPLVATKASRVSDMGSIPIARSINPVDAVEFTGFLHPKFPIKTRVLDAVGPVSDRSGHLGRDDSGIFHFSD